MSIGKQRTLIKTVVVLGKGLPLPVVTLPSLLINFGNPAPLHRLGILATLSLR